ncbi:MAG: DNA alkylation repair protein [Anaerolineales bacterium]
MSEPGELILHLPTDPNPEQVVAALTDAFQTRAEDAHYQSLISTAVPGISPTYGIRVPALREMAKEILRKYKNQTAALQNVAQESWSTKTREHKLVALFIFDGQKDLAPENRWTIGIRFLPDVGNWEECDQLCMAMFGQVIIENPSVMNELEKWIDDPNFWVRRAALVTTVYLRNGKFDDDQALELDALALAMCAARLEDDEKYIRKAVDWAVREVIKRHYNLAFEWMLTKAESAPSSTARSTLNLAAKKLEEEDRARLVEILYSN